MDDRFNIYVEQLRDKDEERIQLTVAPDFLGVDEPDLQFEAPVHLQGEVYLADQELLFRWNIETEAKIRCTICNEWTPVTVKIVHFYTSIPLSEIKSGVYNFKELLRETVLLEVPHFAECDEGNCPKRKEFSPFLKGDAPETDTQGYHPFAEL